jgi:crossover junction endonuclease EME1
MNLDTSFCMESGQIKTGEDKNDTFVKMLQEVVRVTAPIAYGIAADYPSVVSLVKVMRRHGASALEDIEVCSSS